MEGVQDEEIYALKWPLAGVQVEDFNGRDHTGRPPEVEEKLSHASVDIYTYNT